MLIAISVIGLLLAQAVPSFSIQMQNARIRSSAESISSALQLARSEALKRNATVSFILTNSTPAPGGVYTPNVNGSNWVVVADAGADPYVDGRPGAESGGANFIAASAARITFNTLGGTTLAAPASFDFRDGVADNAGTNCAAVGGRFRCLRVTVSPGGQIRMCDPQVSAVGDTRRCS